MNRSLAYYMKAKEILKADVEESLTTYFKQCSMMVTARSLANFGAVLANDGIKPWDNERIVSSTTATFTKSLMMTTGLYNASGIYSAKIGIPTKSGVGVGSFLQYLIRLGLAFLVHHLMKLVIVLLV